MKINRRYEQALFDKKRYLVLYGGAGAGKSYFAAQKILLRCLQEREHNMLVIRKVAQTLRHSVFDTIRDIISSEQLEGTVKINNTDLSIKFANGNQILFSGLDDAQKLKSIHHITSMWIEEATELTEEEFDEVDLRMRGITPNYKQIVLTFNPISALHWIKRRFFDTVDKRASVYKFTYKDNAFLDKEYIDVLNSLSDKNENLYKVYVLGEWGTLSDLVFTNWEVRELTGNEGDVLIAGVDFGYTNPSAVVYVGLKEDRVYVYDEIYASKIVNSELIQMIQEKPYKPVLFFCDTAEPDRIEEFARANLPMGDTEKDVIGGIRLLQSKKIIINSKCTNLIKEIQSYSFVKDKWGNVKEEPIPFNDHLISALRYAVYSYFKNTGLSVYVL